MTDLSLSDVNSPEEIKQTATVVSIKGQVVDGEGEELKEGDQIKLGASVATAEGSAVVIRIAGEIIVLGYQQSLDVDERLLALIEKYRNKESLDEGINLERLEQAIESGLSLDSLLPATASGGTASSSLTGSSGDQGVRFLLSGQQTIPLTELDSHAQGVSGASSEEQGIHISGGGGDEADSLESERPIDSRPEAVDDVDSVQSNLVTSGNVILGVGSLADNAGVNGFSEEALVSAGLGANGEAALLINGSIELVSDKGTLLINSDGSYNYTPNRGASGADVFQYTIRDADGDESTASLTINVDGVPELIISEQEGVVLEAGLSGGTQSGDGSNSTSGSFRFIAGDGSPNVSIAGVSVIEGGELLVSDVQGEFGRLIIESFDGNQINYRYELVQNLDHSGGDLQDSFSILLSDSDGSDSDDASADLSFRILDDAIEASNVEAEVDESLVLEGNVLTSSTITGADSQSSVSLVSIAAINASEGGDERIGREISTEKGVLLVNADGSYRYVANQGASGDDVFTLTLQDSDGSAVNTTLTINVDKANILLDADETDKTLSGTSTSGNVLANTVNPDGPVEAVVTSFEVNGQTFQAGETATITAVGTVSIASNGVYSFSAFSSFSGQVPKISYVVDDSVQTVSSNLNISVQAPNILRDGSETISVAEDTVSLANVLANTVNPDGPNEFVTGFSLLGVNYRAGEEVDIPDVGQLLINVNGDFKFTPSQDFNGQLPTVTYVVSDGISSVSSTLTLIVDSVNDLSDEGEKYSTLEDTNLSGNVLDNAINPDGPEPVEVLSFSVNGQSYTAGELAEITEAGKSVGQIAINSDGSFEFSPTENYSGNVPEVSYTVSDGHSKVDSTLTINVGEQNDLVDASEVVQSNEDTISRGNLLDNASDSDGPGPLELKSFSVNGSTYSAGDIVDLFVAGELAGELRIAANGDYQFSPVENFNGPLPLIEYQVSDGLDEVTSTLSITITAENDLSDASEVQSTQEDTPVSGDLLGNSINPDGPEAAYISAADIAGQNIDIGLPSDLMIDGVNYGSILINADGSYTYTPAENFSGDVPLITYQLSDGAGSVSSTLSLSVAAVNDLDDLDESITIDEDTPISGNVLSNSDNPDGPQDVEVTKFTIAGVDFWAGQSVDLELEGIVVGKFQLQASGDFSFIPAENYNGEVPLIEYELTDGLAVLESTLQISINAVDDGDPNVIIRDANGDEFGQQSVAEDGELEGQSFTISTPNGFSSLTIESTEISLAQLNAMSDSNPIIINGQEGELRLTNFTESSGQIEYSYLPSEASKNHINEVSDSFSIQVKDQSDKVGSSTLDISITDTAPVANADEDSTQAGSNAFGNVRADDADGADTAEITGVTVGTETGEITSGVGTSIAGALGSITINADGSYTYVPGVGADALAEGASEDDVFSYTLKDADGDFSTTTITVTVTGTTDGAPTIDVSAGEVVENATIEGNTFTISAADGLASLSVAGEVITSDTLNNLPVNGVAIDTDEGVLTVTAFDADTGVVTYNYDPSGTAKDHSAGDVIDTLELIVEDSDGTQTSDNLVITITDTEPTANADENNTNADVNATGNVRSDDVDGADAAEITGVTTGTEAGEITSGVGTSIAGALGSITINADGSYTYEPGNGADALAEGATAEDVFSYTLKDSDGDFSTTTITVTVTGTTDGAPTIDVSAGEVVENATIEGNTFTISAADGLASLSIAGEKITALALADASNTPIEVTTDEGVLTLTAFDADTGVVTYNYDPSGTAKDHSAGDVNDTLELIVEDSDGTQTSDDLVITITDTEPTANADVDGTDADSNATGNVRMDAGGVDVDGADAAEITGVVAGSESDEITTGVGQSIAGVLGNITINADGSYTYVPGAGADALAEGASAEDVFSYTLKDADGDFSTTIITVTVTGTTDGAPTIDVNAADVVENAVVEGNSFTISAADGLASLSIAGDKITALALADASNTPIEVTTDEGVLTVTAFDADTGVVTYNYDPSGTAKDHSAGGVFDTLELIVEDSDGTQTSDDLVITISDTAPTAIADEDDTDADSNATGNVRSDAGGADTDGADAAEITGVTAGTATGEITSGVGTSIAGALGSITINTDGSYTYVPGAGADALAEGASADDVFSYTLKDADGDFSTTTITVTVTGTTDGAPTIDVSAGEVVENATIEGNTFIISAADGLASLSIAGEVITSDTLNNLPVNGVAIDIDEGVLTVTAFDADTGVVTYNYDPSGTAKDHSAGDVIDTLSLIVEDSDGTQTSDNLVITVTDTEPTANADENNTNADVNATGNVRSDDVNGADAAEITGVAAGTETGEIPSGVGISITGALGSITINADGSYTYVPGAGADALAEDATAEDVFSYTLKDADGDFSTTTITVTVTGTTDGAPTIDVSATDVVENAVIEGNSFTISAADGLASLSIAGEKITALALADASNTPIEVTTDEGLLTLTAFDADTGVVTYNYDPSGTAKDHSAGDVIDTLELIVEDSDGTQTSDDLVITISDTEPTAIADEDDTDADSNATGNVRSDAGGADTDGADAAEITGVTVGTETAEISSGVGQSISGALGSITINADGFYTYVPGAGADALAEGASADDVFSYTLKDADGDFSTTTITVTVTGTTDGAPTIDVSAADVIENAVVEGNSFTISAADGLASLSIAGEEISAEALADAVNTPIEINTDEGVLTVTNFDADSGVVTYYYDPSGTAKDHSAGDVIDTLELIVEDSDGTQSSDSLVITITDTEPTANADANDTDADTNATGNVRTDAAGADEDGADAAAITGVASGTETVEISSGVGESIAGVLGSITINADGSYIYEPGDGADALAEGATSEDVFSYTLKDADGDFSTTTITVTVTGTTDGAPTINVSAADVVENAIVEGNSFTISAADGLASLSIAGEEISAEALADAVNTPIEINTDEGVLTVTNFDAATGVVTYDYDPSGTAKDHSAGDVIDTFELIVEDSDGTQSSDSLVITITDTEPTANADANDTDADTNATGNVRTDAGGADTDGADAAEITGVTAGTETGEITSGVGTSIAGALGNITINTDGSYTYVPGAGADALAEGATAEDVFSYTLKDSDGDFSTTTITVTVTGTTDGIPDIVIDDQNADATGQLSVEEGERVEANFFTVSAPDGLKTLEVGGQSIDLEQLNDARNTPIVIGSDLGELTITGYNPSEGKVIYDYSLKSHAEDHSAGEVSDSFAVTIEDLDGTKANGTLQLLVLDSGPSAIGDSISTSMARAVTVNVLANDDFNKDGALENDTGGVVSATVDPAQGIVEILTDGQLRFEPADGFVGKASVSYIISDSDGSQRSAELEVQVVGVDSISSERVKEGEVVEHSVSLTEATKSVTVFSFAVEFEGADANDVDLSQLEFSDEISYDPISQLITIPEGVNSFTVSLPTSEDRDVESDELYTISISGQSATGTVENDDADIDLDGTNLTFSSGETGLRAEYYGYNSHRTGSSNDKPFSDNGRVRFHSDDGKSGDRAGDKNTLDKIRDAEGVVEIRNGNGRLVGSGESGSDSAADAKFLAREFEFGFKVGNKNSFADDLGKNPHFDRGESIDSGNLAKYVGNNGKNLEATSGVGITTDSVIRFLGSIFLDKGKYDIRFRTDDGFRLYLDGKNVAQIDQNYGSQVSNEFKNISVDGGLMPIEFLYWDNGAQAVLRIEIKESGSPNSEYKVLNTKDFVLLTPDQAEMVPDDASISLKSNGAVLISSGEVYTGSDLDEDISGSSGNDIIAGGLGEDFISGGSGEDIFVFREEDAPGENGLAVETDIIADFNALEDVLDLSDLLDTSQSANNLDGYLHFEKDAESGDILVHINKDGDYTSNTLESDKDDHIIRIENPDAAVFTGSDQEIIDNLINNGAIDTLV